MTEQNHPIPTDTTDAALPSLGVGPSPRAESLYRLAAEHLPVAMVMVDERGEIQLVNTHAEKLFGYDRDELVGHRIGLLVPAAVQASRSPFRPGYLAEPDLRRSWTERELHGRRQDGTEFPVEMVWNTFETADGRFVQVAIVDMTGRQRAEERFRRAVESAPNAMIMIDQAGRMVLVNNQAEQLFGYTRAELLGQLVELLVPPRFRDRHPEYRESFFTQPAVRAMGAGRDLFGQHKDGSEIPIEIGLNPIQTDEGMFVLSAIVDIRERVRLAERARQFNEELERRVAQRTMQLEAANRELEAFSYSVSHDLRAPLRAIDGFSRILISEYGTTLPPEAREYLEDIRANTQQMGRLVDDLLAFSRLNRHPIKRQRVEPASLIRQCLDELRPQRDGRRVEVRTGELPACWADVMLLKQVWLNLLSNALKYTGRRDVAFIELASLLDPNFPSPVYYVKDNGVGFDMRYADKLFGVFQRLHRVEDYEGTGVG
ncbi:MAG: PAS domain S-box protein, partial [Pirellulaceae bacterium]